MNGLIRLKLDEGLVLHIYKDSRGVPTIGRGRNLDSKGISESEADFLFMNDVQEVIADLRKNFDFYDALDEVRQAVFYNIRFNVGQEFFSWTETIKYAKEKDWANCAKEILNSNAARELPERYHRLSYMMQTGEWPPCQTLQHS